LTYTLSFVLKLNDDDADAADDDDDDDDDDVCSYSVVSSIAIRIELSCTKVFHFPIADLLFYTATLYPSPSLFNS